MAKESINRELGKTKRGEKTITFDYDWSISHSVPKNERVAPRGNHYGIDLSHLTAIGLIALHLRVDLECRIRLRRPAERCWWQRWARIR